MIGVVLCPLDHTQRHRVAVVTLLGLAVAATAGATRLQRLVVAGDSMLPTLEPGDRLLVLRGRRARPGALVAVRDPRPGTARLVVKRVAAVGATGVDVRGDNPAHSTDSRTFGPVPPDLVLGTVVWRYAPEARRGRPAPKARRGRPAPAARRGRPARHRQ